MKDEKNITPAANETAVKTADAATGAAQTENITGRGVFVVETVPVGVAVRTAFLSEDGRLLESPTVFPDLMYALAQIDELKQLVTQRFAEAAQIGAQVIAQQLEANKATAAAATTTSATAAPAATPAASQATASKVENKLQ